MEIEAMDLFQVASVVTAARRTGLLGELVSGPRTAGACAERLGLDPRATLLVLEALTTLELAVREGDRYAASPQVRPWLAPTGADDLWERLWDHTPTFLRTGEPLTRMDGAPAEREATYRSGVATLGRLLAEHARELASRLPRAPARVLDVGCGSGVWSLAVAERFPEARVTGVDFPAVLAAFLGRAAELGLGDRVATIAGDMHSVALPVGGFDLVVIANVLRLEPQERAAAVIARLAPAVAPGGALLVVDALAGGTPARERARALYAVNLALRTGAGRVHDPAAIRSWISDAGLAKIEAIELGGACAPVAAVGAVLAGRPA